MGALDDKQFGVTTADGSQGDKGEAIKTNPKFDGDSRQNIKFEGEKAGPSVSAIQMENVGRE
jgi:hypothetical protein